MFSADLEVLNAGHTWLADGRRVVLATVLSTFGSAPRPAGALLALSEHGLLVGSVSGGCIEADLLGRIRDDFPNRPERLTYGVADGTARRFGLPCGGTLELLLEPLEDAAPLDFLRSAIAERRCLMRVYDLVTDAVELVPDPAPDVPEFAFDGRRVSRVYGPRWRMLIIGAGQISRFLADMAHALDYEVLICDPRDEYVASWTGSGRLVLGMPDDVARAEASDARSIVVALTHDPKLDDMALMAALDSAAFYVGALGSSRNQEKRRERLAGIGLSPDQLARLHGPVGYPLGGKTPAEIALATLAEVTGLRHGARLVVHEARPGPASACA